MNDDKLSIEVAEICSELLICDKIRWRVVVFIAKKNRERIRNEREREESRSLGHKLNITKRFINEFNQYI